MKISGFTFVRNATKLYLPVRESIISVLPLVDEFIIALGDCAHDDKTLEEIKKLRDDVADGANPREGCDPAGDRRPRPGGLDGRAA